jgi:MOSC domain-containing protein YiiM
MAVVVAVNRSNRHSFSKTSQVRIRLLKGVGVEGDVHAGAKVQHRYSARKFGGSVENERQVHLIQEELFDELREQGFKLFAGALGENITTRGIDLVSLPKDSRLHIGRQVVVELTGLRTPCRQMDKFAAGLAKAVMVGRAPGEKARSRAGVMAVVVSGGQVRLGDEVKLELPARKHQALRHI